MASLMLGGHTCGAFAPASTRRGPACLINTSGRFRKFHQNLDAQNRHTHRSTVAVTATESLGGSSDSSQPAEERDYTPFARLKEKNPYRLLGLGNDASFEEVQTARNYLYEQYRWHEASRESIELAFDSIIQERLNARNKQGFRPTHKGRRGVIVTAPEKPTLVKRFVNLFDPTITPRTLVNEGAVYLGIALWALFSSDQSFPLAGGFAYSVYKFQSKRMKANPEGPFFGGNAIVGAVLSTVINLGLACVVMAGLSAPLAALISSTIRQVGGCCVIAIMGALGVYLK